MKTMTNLWLACDRMPKILDRIHWELASIPNPSEQQIRVAQEQERKILNWAAKLSGILMKNHLGREWTGNGLPPPPDTVIPDEVAQKILF
jgi:hypothetical protein